MVDRCSSLFDKIWTDQDIHRFIMIRTNEESNFDEDVVQSISQKEAL